MPDFKPLRNLGETTDLLSRREGDIWAGKDPIEVPNAQSFSRQELQRLIPRLEKLAKTLHQAANQKGISVDVVSLIPSKEHPGAVQVLIKPEGYRGDPRSFTLSEQPKSDDLQKVVDQMRRMLPSA